MKLCRRSAFIGLLAGIFIFGIAFTLFLKQPSQKKFAYVNFEKVIKHVISQINQSHNNVMVTEEVEAYKGLFVKTLDDYAKKENIIIFSSPKPVSGAKDVTDLVMEKAFGKSRKDGR